MLTPLFEAHGCRAMDVPVLQPADPFLNATGEALRRRLFVTNSVDGELLCLRPEFTIPVCLAHGSAPAKYHYNGTVFRQRDNAPVEFQQAGVEALGDADKAKADADMVALAFEAVKASCDCELEIVIGDPAFFDALVGPAGLPVLWRERLLRAFGDDKVLDDTLGRMAKPEVQTDDAYQNVDAAALETIVADMQEAHGMVGVGGRSAEHIAARYMAKRSEGLEISGQMVGLCKLFLEIECTAQEVSSVFRYFGEEHDLDFSAVVDAFQVRMNSGMNKLKAPITFSARFGRRLDYYTGFVFEIYERNDRTKGPLAGGGRYDGLMELLGGAPTPAVGFALWLDRMEGGK